MPVVLLQLQSNRIDVVIVFNDGLPSTSVRFTVRVYVKREQANGKMALPETLHQIRFGRGDVAMIVD